MRRWTGSVFGTHDFEEKNLQLGPRPIIELTCRVCGRAFQLNDFSKDTWAIAPDGVLSRDTDERWQSRPCPGRPRASDQELRRWLKGIPVDSHDEIEIGRAIAQGRAEDLIDDFSLDGSVGSWHHDFNSGSEWLEIVTAGGREVVKFSHEEIADCSSEGPDGRQIREGITAKLTKAVKKFSGSKERIGF